MVNDGGCPFMFDGTLSFDRVLMPASQASTAWSNPLPPLRGPPPPASGEASFGERGPPPPCKRGEARFEVERRGPCTCQQKLDTKLKKLGIKIEYLYKAQ